MILFNCINLHALATSWHWKWNLGGGGFVSSSLVVRLGTGCLDLSSGANVICKLTLEERLPGMRNRESTRSTFFYRQNAFPRHSPKLLSSSLFAKHWQVVNFPWQSPMTVFFVSCSWALQQSMVETPSALTSHLPRKVGCQNLQCDTVAVSNGCFLLFSLYQPLSRQTRGPWAEALWAVPAWRELRMESSQKDLQLVKHPGGEGQPFFPV